MSNKICIPAECENDPFYRYKRRKLQFQVITNFILVTNISDVAKDLKRETVEIVDWLTSKIKRSRSVRYVEQGNIMVLKIANKSGECTIDFEAILEEYIKLFVLCCTCKNPETIYYITEMGKMRVRCKACGDVRKLKDHTFKSVIRGHFKKRLIQSAAANE